MTLLCSVFSPLSQNFGSLAPEELICTKTALRPVTFPLWTFIAHNLSSLFAVFGVVGVTRVIKAQKIQL